MANNELVQAMTQPAAGSGGVAATEEQHEWFTDAKAHASYLALELIATKERAKKAERKLEELRNHLLPLLSEGETWHDAKWTEWKLALRKLLD